MEDHAVGDIDPLAGVLPLLPQPSFYETSDLLLPLCESVSPTLVSWFCRGFPALQTAGVEYVLIHPLEHVVF